MALEFKHDPRAPMDEKLVAFFKFFAIMILIFGILSTLIYFVT